MFHFQDIGKNHIVWTCQNCKEETKTAIEVNDKPYCEQCAEKEVQS